MPVSAEPAATGAGWLGRPLVLAVATLSIIGLPALVAGAGLDAPVGADEIARVSAALADPQGREHGPASLFYCAILPGEFAAEVRTLIPRARLACVAATFVITALLYLTLALVRSRATGLLGCCALALAPPIAEFGYLLRPEYPVTVFCMLGVILLAGMPGLLARRRRSALRHSIAICVLIAAVAGFCALTVGTCPSYGVVLLVPGGCMLLAIVLAMLRFGSTLRRRGVALAPFWGVTRRSLPWFVAAFAAMSVSSLVLAQIDAPPMASATGAGLCGSHWYVAWPLGFCAVVGGLVWLLRIGFGLGRRRHVDAEAVLFVFVAVMILQRFRVDASTDALPAAPAMAALVAFGVRFGLQWIVGLWRRRISAG